MPDAPTALPSPVAGTIARLQVAVGDVVSPGDVVALVEIMKMEHPVTARTGGMVVELHVAEGDQVEAGDHLLLLAAAPAPGDGATHPAGGEATSADPTGTPEDREDLARLQARRAQLEDDARPDAVARRRAQGHRTARENVDAVADPGSFVEYGGLAIAAQRGRRGVEALERETPADGLLTGIATINADLVGPDRAQAIVLAYDYTVLAGTQGQVNHSKKDRMFELAAERRLPVVFFVEGGGGRPGDTDAVGASWLDARAFALWARLSGDVPLVAIVNGRCFAGNAALAGCADVIIATRSSNLGMAGPAMIEGGGLGRVTPEDIGPVDVQAPNGVIDVVVEDEAEAAEVARRYLGYFQGPVDDWTAAAQEPLRDAVPANRKRVYDMRVVLDRVADVGSLLELRRDFAPGMLTALARIEGRPVGVLANDPAHLGGAIDADGADAAARFLQLCEGHGLPVVVFCDTPGFMVGPEAERDAGVRRFSRMFVAGANLSVPVLAVITRKAYGLGAQAMLGGHLQVPFLTVGWPTSELGPMGLEGAVRLGFRRELDAIDDPDERAVREEQMIALAHANAAGLNVASFGEIDDVIDPAETRHRLAAALHAATATTPPRAPGRRFIDTW